MITSTRLLRRALGWVATVMVVVIAAAMASVAVVPTAHGSVQEDEPHPIRVVTIAGTGEVGYSGDGGDALDARLNEFAKLDVDSQGNVYVADSFNKRVRVVRTDGTIDTVPGTRAQRAPANDGPDVGGWVYSPSNAPQSVTLTDDDVLYVAADENIRRREADGQFTVITTSDGDGSFGDGGNGGDGGPATGAFVYEPGDVAVDDQENVYIADTVNHRIRRVDPAGIITTVAGGGDLDLDASEGGPAIEASVYQPESVAVDSEGAVYFTENLGSRTVRRIDPDGTITTVVGLEPEGFAGDGGPVDEAQFSGNIRGIAVDDEDNLYVADTGNHHVRVVDTEGTVTSIPALVPEAEDVAVGPDGDVYVTGAGRVRRVERNGDPAASDTDDGRTEPSRSEGARWADEEPGTIVTVAGAAYEDPEDPLDEPEEEPPAPVADSLDSVAAVASGGGPRGVAVDADGNLYVADATNHRVVRVEADGSLTTVAGTSETGDVVGADESGPATDAVLHTPEDLAVDTAGNLYIADPGDDLVRKVDPDGTITTVAGTGATVDTIGGPPHGDGGPAVEANLNHPSGVAVDAAGNLYIAEAYSSVVRKVDPSGVITTIAGGGDLWANAADGAPATQASLWEPVDVSVDAAGNVYLIEGRNQSVRRVGPDGTLTTVAGDSYFSEDEGGFAGDGGPGSSAELNTPGATAVDAAGNLYIADTYNSRIRKVDPAGTITTVAGTGETSDSGDGGPAIEAGLAEPRDVAVDADGNIYLAGPSSGSVRRIDPEGTITTVAEVGADGADDPADEERATEVELSGPDGIAVDGDGNLYVGEPSGLDRDGALQPGQVRRVSPDGTMTAVDGNAAEGAFGDVAAVAVDDAGRVYAVARGMVARRDLDGVVTVIAGGGTGSYPEEDEVEVDGAIATTVPLVPVDIAVDPGGEVYVATQESVLRLTPESTLTTIFGPDDGGADGVGGIAADGDGNVYVVTGSLSDGPDQVHRVSADGNITVIAGTADDESRSSDGEDDIDESRPATEAVLDDPRDVAVDADGNVYVSEQRGIRRIDPNGFMTTVVRSPSETETDDGYETTTYTATTTLATDAAGDVYFVEPDTHRVRVVVRPANISASGTSPSNALLKASIVLAAAVLLVAAMRWRHQLATLLPSTRTSTRSTDPADDHLTPTDQPADDHLTPTDQPDETPTSPDPTGGLDASDLPDPTDQPDDDDHEPDPDDQADADEEAGAGGGVR